MSDKPTDTESLSGSSSIAGKSDSRGRAINQNGGADSALGSRNKSTSQNRTNSGVKASAPTRSSLSRAGSPPVPSSSRLSPANTERRTSAAQQSQLSSEIQSSREASIARLQSPMPIYPSPSNRAAQTPPTVGADSTLPVNELSGLPRGSVGQTGESALSNALRGGYGGSPQSQHGFKIGSLTPSRPESVNEAANYLRQLAASETVGTRSANNASPVYEEGTAIEDPAIVIRHVAGNADADYADYASDQPAPQSVSGNTSAQRTPQLAAQRDEPSLMPNDFASLRSPGGDVSRGVLRWARDQMPTPQRRKSYTAVEGPTQENETTAADFRVPQAFRRAHVNEGTPLLDRVERGQSSSGWRPARTFPEFLTLYGNYAGEDLDSDGESDDEDDDQAEYGNRELGEDAPLLSESQRLRRKHRGHGETSTFGAVMMLLKSFVGTGILFLPKAFLNGGMLFSAVVLLGVASLSWWSFILLVKTKLKIGGSFGGMGQKTWGTTLRWLIQFSLILSQIGFASAYFIFTAENIKQVVEIKSKCSMRWTITWLIVAQWGFFSIVSMFRKIRAIENMALFADALIVGGIVFLFTQDVATISSPSWHADIAWFNRHDWTQFIGTAIFTFEGIGLIIPIQNAMSRPQQFPSVLSGVMITVMVIFTVMGAISYLAFGSKTQTVVLRNLDQENQLVLVTQLAYAVAIVMSTPLQLFPAIEIASIELFGERSGRHDTKVKYSKNLLRLIIVTVCALIAYVGSDDLDKFIAAVGSIACVPLVYIYPPLLHYRTIARTRLAKGADMALCSVGIVAMVYTGSRTIDKWTRGEKSAPVPGYCDAR